MRSFLICSLSERSSSGSSSESESASSSGGPAALSDVLSCDAMPPHAGPIRCKSFII